MFDTWKKEERDLQVMKVQRTVIFLLFVICLLAFAGWMSAPSRMIVYVPPDISNGATLKPNQIPGPLVYAFAYEVWQEINYWPHDGTQDYKNNIHTYWSYLTPDFKANLLLDDANLQAAGQLDRQRYLQGMNGAAFNAANVKKIGVNTWEVDLTMRLTEYNNNQPVKDIEILYPLKVTRRNISQQDNPYGLVIAGFVSQPQRLKTYI